jgi:hypothetical protein
MCIKHFETVMGALLDVALHDTDGYAAADANELYKKLDDLQTTKGFDNNLTSQERNVILNALKQ